MGCLSTAPTSIHRPNSSVHCSTLIYPLLLIRSLFWFSFTPFSCYCILFYCSVFMLACVLLNYFVSLYSLFTDLSHGFQCSPTLNRQPYEGLEGRLLLTSWWKKSSNVTIGQSSLISLTHHCYHWHPGSRCGWTCNQLTSKVDGGITGSRLKWSILT